jgi:ABC-type uncharacterized transport system permease subunit
VIFYLHLLALGLYGVATALAVAPFIGRPPVPRGLLLAVPSAGAAFHVAGLAQVPLVGLAPALSLLALFLVILQVVSERVLRASSVGLFTGPLAAGLVGLALLIGFGPEGGTTLGRAWWFVLHVTLSVLGVALLALAFFASALYLVQFRELKSKRFGQVFQSFPPLERLDQLNLVALGAGFPVLTIGVLIALGYAVRFTGGLEVAKAQAVWGLFTWVVLGWAVWVRHVRHWGGRRGAFASIAGFGAVLLVYLALKLAIPGTTRFL